MMKVLLELGKRLFQYERSTLMRYIIRVNKRCMVEEVNRGGDSEGYMGCRVSTLLGKKRYRLYRNYKERQLQGKMVYVFSQHFSVCSPAS